MPSGNSASGVRTLWTEGIGDSEGAISASFASSVTARLEIARWGGWIRSGEASFAGVRRQSGDGGRPGTLEASIRRYLTGTAFRWCME